MKMFACSSAGAPLPALKFTIRRGLLDPDGDEVRYSLSGTDAGLFNMAPLTGDLFTTGTHQYEGDGPYSITITAADPSGGSASIKAAITPSGSKGAPVVTGPREIRYPENGTCRGSVLARRQPAKRDDWLDSLSGARRGRRRLF